jgi:hypothetical protein
MIAIIKPAFIVKIILSEPHLHAHKSVGFGLQFELL